MFATEESEATGLLSKKTLTSEEQEPTNKTGRPAFHYAILLTLTVGAIFLVIARNLPTEDVLFSSTENSRSITTIQTPQLHFSIVHDKKTGLTTVVDNAPILCRHSVLSDMVTCPERASVELGTAEYSVNLDGNGWNYMSITAIDMLELKIQDTSVFDEANGVTIDTKVHQDAKHDKNKPQQPVSYRFGDYIDVMKKANDLTLVRQQYVRSMHSVGVLEGYLSCKAIGDWYANFYDGLFGGGEVNLPTMEFLEANHVWMNTQAALYWEVDDYWMSVKGLLAQLEGLLIGARTGCPGVPLDDQSDDAHNINTYKGIFMPTMEHGVTMQHLLLMNANGDLFQVMQKYPANLVDTSGNGRHGDQTIDTDGVVDDYVDDYTIAKVHNITTTHADDDEETYAYSDVDALYETSTPTQDEQAKASAADAKDPKYNHPARRLARKLLARAQTRPTVTGPPQPLDKDLTKKQIRALPNLGSDHCSALIKILPDLSDVVFGHDTWDAYQTAYPRVFKHVSYNRMKNSLPIPNDMMNIYFSASPGLLASIDDFYVIHGNVANLAVTETSLDVYNDNLINLISPTTMLCWARTIVSNRLSTSGNAWAENFARYSSGTYSNQWMVLDFNKFEPYKPPRNGFLTVLEEIPGLVHHEDLTDILVAKSYWASYNNPYFKEISYMSGVTAKCEVDNTYCHSSTPRAKIFRAQHSTVRSVADLQSLMEYNQYVSDPFSKLDSCKAIACRKDLEPNLSRRSPFGAIDSKVTSANLARRNPPSAASLRTASVFYTRAIAEKPVVFVKLGPATLSTPAFCWSQIGITTLDTTTVVPVVLPPGHNATEEKIELGNNRRVLADEEVVAGEPTAVPTMAPTFKQGPRVYVHKGHPDCFDFQWEILPPRE